MSAAINGRGRMYLLDEAAETYAPILTKSLLRRLIYEGRIASSKVGKRRVLFESDIEAFLEANRTEATVSGVVQGLRPRVSGPTSNRR